MPRSRSKYGKALQAVNNRDVNSLSWELLKLALKEMEAGGSPEMGKTVILELLKNITQQTKGKMKLPGGGDASALEGWLAGKGGDE